MVALIVLLAAPISPAPPPVTATPVPVRTIVGSIVSVDAVRGEAVVTESVTRARQAKHRAETVTLRVDATTELLRGKARVSLVDLAPGDHAVARYSGPPAGARAISVRVADPVKALPGPTRPPS